MKVEKSTKTKKQYSAEFKRFIKGRYEALLVGLLLSCISFVYFCLQRASADLDATSEHIQESIELENLFSKYSERVTSNLTKALLSRSFISPAKPFSDKSVDWRKKLTLVVVAEAFPDDPDISVFEEVYGSMLYYIPKLRLSSRVIALDGPNPDLSSKRNDAYLKKIDAIRKRFQPPHWNGTSVCVSPSFGHFTGNLLHALINCVDTPLILIAQHNMKLLRDIPNFIALTSAMLNEDHHINYIYFRDTDKDHHYYRPECATRLHRNGSNKHCYISMMRSVRFSSDVILTRFVGFEGPIHLAKRQWYIDQILLPSIYFKEDYHKTPKRPSVIRINKEVGWEVQKLNDVRDPWPQEFNDWGVYMYGKFDDPDSREFSSHVASRCEIDEETDVQTCTDSS